MVVGSLCGLLFSVALTCFSLSSLVPSSVFNFIFILTNLLSLLSFPLFCSLFSISALSFVVVVDDSEFCLSFNLYPFPLNLANFFSISSILTLAK